MIWAQDGTVVPQTFLKFQSHGSHSYMLEDTGWTDEGGLKYQMEPWRWVENPGLAIELHLNGWI